MIVNAEEIPVSYRAIKNNHNGKLSALVVPGKDPHRKLDQELKGVW